MKNLKKALALLTAVSALAASTSALAATTAATSVDFTGTPDIALGYDDADVIGAVPTVGVTIADGVADEGKQISFLVLNAGVNELAIDADDILYIDQDTAVDGGNTFTAKISLDRVDAGLSELPIGEYPVKVGYYADGDFEIAAATLVISEAQEEPATITFKWGDVDCSGGDKAVNANDASAILGWITGGLSTYSGYTFNQEAVVEALPEN